MQQTSPEYPDDTDPVAVGPSRRIRVLLIDQNQLLAESLAFYLASDPDIEVVGTLSEPDLGTSRASRLPSDVVVVSYPLLQSGGDRLLGALREEAPDVKSIVLIARLDDETLTACVKAGAVGCVSRDSPPAQLVRAIKRVHAGEVLFAPEVLVRLLTRSQRPAPDPVHLMRSLAPRELKVLETLATGASTEQVAERLCITSHTVRTHVKNAMSKLGASSKLEAVLIALRAGLISLSD